MWVARREIADNTADETDQRHVGVRPEPRESRNGIDRDSVKRPPRF